MIKRNLTLGEGEEQTSWSRRSENSSQNVFGARKFSSSVLASPKRNGLRTRMWVTNRGDLDKWISSERINGWEVVVFGQLIRRYLNLGEGVEQTNSSQRRESSSWNDCETDLMADDYWYNSSFYYKNSSFGLGKQSTPRTTKHNSSFNYKNSSFNLQKLELQFKPKVSVFKSSSWRIRGEVGCEEGEGGKWWAIQAFWRGSYRANDRGASWLWVYWALLCHAFSIMLFNILLLQILLGKASYSTN